VFWSRFEPNATKYKPEELPLAKSLAKMTITTSTHILYAVNYAREREREREREKGVAAVRDTTLGRMETLILFEGSQAMPAGPSDRGEILFKVIEVRAAALERKLCWLYGKDIH
jgi:hypothetical protein